MDTVYPDTAAAAAAAAGCATCTLSAPICIPLEEGVSASVYDQMFYLKTINQISQGKRNIRQLIKI